ncbi:hypothetical protein LguiB_026407 [Lonicera macranthoides]
MGKKEQQQQQELLKTLGDFTSKDNWDKFFSIRGTDDSFEWYADWPQLRHPLLSHLSTDEPSESSSTSSAGGEVEASSSAQILVPGCGNSRLSEHLYDAGFRDITNIDFSKVVISEMLRRNVRLRPGMRWRVMDMTSMQFVDGTFDAVIDKGGLDALMEPELGPKLGSQYLSEAKRVLKSGGKFICLTLAEAHVLGLLFPKFRYGWIVSLHAIPQKPSKRPSLQTFMVVAKKDSSIVMHQVSSSFTRSTIDCSGDQARGLFEALDIENRIRKEHASGSDLLYSLEDLQLGAGGDLTELSPGRRLLLTLGEPGSSRFFYKAVLLDALQQSSSFLYSCGVFLVPKTRAHEWLFSSEEGQWTVVESSKAARLIMVLLDTSHSNASMDDIQKDLSPMVKHLAPGENGSGAQIPFMVAGDGIKQRKVFHQVSSALTGPIIVDDVVYEKVDDDLVSLFPSKELVFRRLTFQRSEGLVQSEALLTREGCQNVASGKEQKTRSLSKSSKKKGNQRRSDSLVSVTNDSRNELKVDHDYLASSYHTGIISGFMLISSYLESVASTGRTVKAIVIGLGAGLLPMYLHKSLPFLYIEVVELDPVVLDLAKDYFGFKEDEHLKVHITDGIEFVKEAANNGAANGVTANGNEDAICTANNTSNGSCDVSQVEGKGVSGVGILIVDVDSSDSSSGMTCPAADFVEESFLLTAKNSLSEQGLFIVNLVSRSSAIKDLVISRMKVVFSDLYSLELEEDVNEVIFAVNTRDNNAIKEEDQFAQASHQLEKLLKLKHPERGQTFIDAAKKIKRL